MRYDAHDYQKYATRFILTHPIAAVFLEMGLGKSVITLTALFDLCLDQFLIRKVLVIAPLRVARDTWPSEIKKWDHLDGLLYSVVVGTEAERRAALMRTADVYIINRENVDWLITKSKIPFDFDMVVIDELSSFKSYQAKRFKSLLKARPTVKRIVGLTGTPSSNGLMDLWAEFRVLDAEEMRDLRHTTADGYIEGETLEDTVIRRMELETLQEAMQSLTQIQRERLHLYFFHGLTFRQIAQKTGVSDKSVRESIEASLKKIKKYFN